ncbi:hypothetical protein BDV95DRAFT_594999 [Massariosphaeria phaeospora]|uniref:Uncharacterized protein n=1 Tax=Massariosphaeria phaeospora TaxID=100035 RepID=A0A7C8M962_9PLEO|nr:hypothetical protein BDV95DRAFT_594999 [Massariosphaeria phaeospora]
MDFRSSNPTHNAPVDARPAPPGNPIPRANSSDLHRYPGSFNIHPHGYGLLEGHVLPDEYVFPPGYILPPGYFIPPQIPNIPVVEEDSHKKTVEHSAMSLDFSLIETWQNYAEAHRPSSPSLGAATQTTCILPCVCATPPDVPHAQSCPVPHQVQARDPSTAPLQPPRAPIYDITTNWETIIDYVVCARWLRQYGNDRWLGGIRQEQLWAFLKYIRWELRIETDTLRRETGTWLRSVRRVPRLETGEDQRDLYFCGRWLREHGNDRWARGVMHGQLWAFLKFVKRQLGIEWGTASGLLAIPDFRGVDDIGPQAL